jgi:hypothetical protein
MAGTASAQPGTIAPGRTVDGRLEASDARAGEDEPRYDEYRIQLRANQRVRLSLESEDFDPMLMLFRPGETDEPAAVNDDFGESLNSRLSYAAPADGSYVVRVTSYDSEMLGRYRLQAEALAPLPPPVTAHSETATTSWRVYRGELGPRDPDNEGLRFDDYLVTLRQGESIVVRVDAEAFDPMVQILSVAGRSGDPLAADDDNGPGNNALIGFDAPAAGDYIVRVTSFGPETGGAYTLRIGS